MSQAVVKKSALKISFCFTWLQLSTLLTYCTLSRRICFFLSALVASTARMAKEWAHRFVPLFFFDITPTLAPRIKAANVILTFCPIIDTRWTWWPETEADYAASHLVSCWIGSAHVFSFLSMILLFSFLPQGPHLQSPLHWSLHLSCWLDLKKRLLTFIIIHWEQINIQMCHILVIDFKRKHKG